jgi:hypothetical protein
MTIKFLQILESQETKLAEMENSLGNLAEVRVSEFLHAADLS